MPDSGLPSTSPITIALGMGSAAFKGLVGNSQIKKAKRELSTLTPPAESVPSDLLESQEQARINAANGLPSEQYNMAMKNIQRQQASALRGANDRRMGGQLTAGIQDNTNNALANLDAKNAAARLNNEGALYKINAQVGNVKRDLFNKDIRQKYWNDYNYAMSLLGTGHQNVAGAFDSGLAALGRSGYDASKSMGSMGNLAGSGASGGAMGDVGGSALGLLGGGALGGGADALAGIPSAALFL